MVSCAWCDEKLSSQEEARAVLDVLHYSHLDTKHLAVRMRFSVWEVSPGYRLDGNVADYTASLHWHGCFAQPSGLSLRTTPLVNNNTHAVVARNPKRGMQMFFCSTYMHSGVSVLPTTSWS
jgi:hypothetical protein